MVMRYGLAILAALPLLAQEIIPLRTRAAIDPSAPKELLTTGLPASPGAASGKLVFTADDAEAQGDKGRGRQEVEDAARRQEG